MEMTFLNVAIKKIQILSHIMYMFVMLLQIMIRARGVRCVMHVYQIKGVRVND